MKEENENKKVNVNCNKLNGKSLIQFGGMRSSKAEDSNHKRIGMGRQMIK